MFKIPIWYFFRTLSRCNYSCFPVFDRDNLNRHIALVVFVEVVWV